MKRLLAGLGVALACAGTPALADTVFLKDGRILTGRVVDKGDTIFVEHKKHGGITVARSDVIRIQLDQQPEESERTFDEVVLKDGRIVRGDVRLSPDGNEVIVGMGERGEVRHPRTAVDVIHRRDGRKEVLGVPGAEDDPGVAELKVKIERLVDDLAKTNAVGDPDLAAQGTARRELLALGVFARSYLEALEGERRERVEGILADLDRLEGLRRVLPQVVEKKHPRIGERLIDLDEGARETAVRTCVMEAPHKIGPLLLHLVRQDRSPRIRAFCVSQLSALRKFEQLAEVLRLSDGPLRLAAAFALGDAGILAGVPILIEALRLSDAQIRSAAINKLREYTKQHFGYRPNAPEEAREESIAKWNAWWNENGRDLVRRGVREVAPDLEGARLTPEEEKQARDLWAQAAAIVASEQQAAEERQETEEDEAPKELSPNQARDRRLRLERALDLLRKALELDPSLSTARMTRAVLLYEEFQRMEQATYELNRILDRAGHDAGDADEARKFAHYHLGNIALRDRAFKKATLAYSQSLQYDEGYLDALIGQADAYLGLALDERRKGEGAREARLEALDSARVAFERVLTALAEQDDELLKMVADLQKKGSKTVEESQVIQAVRRSRRSLDQRKAEVHSKLGRLEAARQRDVKALQHYRTAARLDPDNVTYEEAVKLWEGIVGKQQGQPER
jgi:tetratricopeptide (TPR) repeat protein